MTRIAALIAATALFATPAVAGTYSAKPINAPSQANIIRKDRSCTFSADASPRKAATYWLPERVSLRIFLTIRSRLMPRRRSTNNEPSR